MALQTSPRPRALKDGLYTNEVRKLEMNLCQRYVTFKKKYKRKFHTENAPNKRLPGRDVEEKAAGKKDFIDLITLLVAYLLGRAKARGANAGHMENTQVLSIDIQALRTETKRVGE